MDDLRFPIGKFDLKPTEPISQQQIEAAIDDIAALPGQLRRLVSPMSAEQLETPYRDGGWTVRQTVHHIADSHMNSFIRFRLALTEDRPTVKPYNEKDWAELVDARTAGVELSLSLIAALHARWIILLRAMSPEDFRKPFVHPEFGERRLDWNTLLYAWHSRHHLSHIARLCDRMGWTATQSAVPARG